MNQHNPPISQGNTGTCWCFSTSSMLESDAFRINGIKVMLSEMYTVYWEYVEKALRYVKERVRINPDDYVDILSYTQEPFYRKVEYKVQDNWWHDSSYYNVPVVVFMEALKKAVRNGYTITIGGDVSEPGMDRKTQCAVVPDFDIPSAYINDDARQFRFSNKTTTDDHGMHVVGYLEKDGKDWYLIKDSSSGSRNNDSGAPEFGYYFY
jgi:bleomycin hydrolase